MLHKHPEPLDEAEREATLSLIAAETGSLPVSAWRIAEDNELTSRVNILEHGVVSRDAQ